MAERSGTIAFVRGQEAPLLPAPPSTVGVRGWLFTNLFSSAGNCVLTAVLGALLFWFAWSIADWAVFQAAWTGTDREACVGKQGACWPLIADKFPQWIYGFYPIDQRWRPNIAFLLGAAALVPMLMPAAPYKLWNAIFLLAVYPLITLVLLTGGNFDFQWADYLSAIGVVMMATAALVPIAALGLELGVARNTRGLGLIGAGLVSFVVLLFLDIPYGDYLVRALLVAGAALSLWTAEVAGGRRIAAVWVGLLMTLLLVMVFLDFDFGLEAVETTQWGGLLVTLVVSATGIVASLPIGIFLALGRRSKMPVVRLFSVLFIELWRGVPLITVLFMSSVMLPLFLPEGVNFDKLLRALIGVALFSAAYMAEVVRSGLQAIPRGQYEGAMALGLSYWQTMRMIVLPQALKVSIPNIVGNFISLFKDTTLVAIIGIFDLFGVVRTGLKDANWATPTSVVTGYLTVAALFWVFCFAISRYSIYTERRLHTGHRR